MTMKVMAFDLGDTLVEYEGVPLSWEAHYSEALSRLAAQIGKVPTGAGLVAAGEVLRRYNTRLNPRTNEIGFDRILRELLPALGFSGPAGELSCARAFFGVFQQRLRVFPETRRALDQLRRSGAAIAVFTDVPYGMPRELVLDDVRGGGLEGCFDLLLTSRDAGVRKPAPGALQAVATALRCDAGDMAYVGNERKDVEAARGFGCRAILIDRARTGAAWGQHQTIASLDELCTAAGPGSPLRTHGR